MNKNEIIKFLKENLRLNVREEGGSFGSQKYTVIELKIENEVINEIFLDEK